MLTSDLSSDLFVSTIYILFTLTTAEFLRKVVNLISTEGSFLYIAASEFIAIFELSAVCYELNLVADVYGYTAYWVYLFLASIWWSLRWGDATGCPYTHVEEWLDGKVGTGIGTLLTIIEILGGLIFYRFFLKYLWTLGYGENHIYKVRQIECYSDIQTDPWIASLIEAAGVFICQFVAKFLSHGAYFSSMTDIILNAAIGTTLVVAAFTTSGGYFNPALATALQYGCSGATPFQHVLVYWIGDILGSVAAFYSWKYLFISKSKIQDMKTD